MASVGSAIPAASSSSHAETTISPVTVPASTVMQAPRPTLTAVSSKATGPHTIVVCIVAMAAVYASTVAARRSKVMPDMTCIMITTVTCIIRATLRIATSVRHLLPLASVA